MITENSKITFGRTYKGRRIKDCPENYLKWMARELWNTDLHEFAYVSRQVLDKREDEDRELNLGGDLEAAADEFLRAHDIDPRKYKS